MDEMLGNFLIIRCISSKIRCVKCEEWIQLGEICTILVGRAKEPGVHFAGFMCNDCWKIEDVREYFNGTVDHS